MALYDEKTFEAAALKITDQVFSPYTSHRHNYKIDSDIEFDAYYEGEFIIHCVEITVSQKASKLDHDLKKLDWLHNYYSKQTSGKKSIRCWTITRDSLTHEQFSLIKQYRSHITHITYKELVSKLIDTHLFLERRQQHRFGSFDPLKKKDKTDVFVNAPFKILKNTGKFADADKVYNWIKQGHKKHFIVTGDFGSGKSTFLKLLYDKIVQSHIRNEELRFPIYLNLRDFAELEHPDEALRRHARRIGLSEFGEKLIGAWKADYTSLIIDGFDEVSPRNTAREVKRQRDLKQQALQIVKRFVENTPTDTPILISGRTGFFQSLQEMEDAIGVSSKWEQLESTEFDENQIQNLQGQMGTNITIPQWIPRTPLLIGYFIEWLQENPEIVSDYSDSSNGWLHLLNRFCEREVKQIDTLPMIKEDLFDLYGELAITARKRNDGTGPIDLNDIVNAYRHLFKDEPTGSALGQLMRMPGLVPTDAVNLSHNNSTLNDLYNVTDLNKIQQKRFINRELVDIASGRYLGKFIQTSNRDIIKNYVGVKSTISESGLGTITKISHEANHIPYFISEINSQNTENYAQIDLISCLIYNNFPYTNKSLTIDDLHIDYLNFSEDSYNYSKFRFANCYIETFEMSINTSVANRPNFENCIFGNLYIDCEESKFDEKILNGLGFFNCSVEYFHFQRFNTNSYLLSDLSEEASLLASIFQKTYRQSMTGRLEKAILSGIKNHQTMTVHELLEKLQHNHFLTRERVDNENRWRPLKDKLDVVNEFLSSPSDKKYQEIVG
ncbi:NACHT domain-containing protein [Rhizobium sp. NRK18]|uniref:NACHT domain-containing protein n=1 Tax=Rhizobium sp. NRK18 TaxID=2964667 RepID=UPI0021C3C6AD|nr:ATP-binding protein [Rhizobium sp. NRK18]MCQ2004419.1 ATP-binding protein [Rhizobium sp. NRK18]